MSDMNEEYTAMLQKEIEKYNIHEKIINRFGNKFINFYYEELAEERNGKYLSKLNRILEIDESNRVPTIDKETSLNWDLFKIVCKRTHGKVILIRSFNPDMHYTKAEIMILKENIKKAKEYGIEAVEFQEGFSIKQAETASNKLENWISEINNAKYEGRSLSPLEKFVMAYNIATSFEYRYEDKGENPFASRDINYILSGNKIVCVGFASLLKCLCKGIGITCEYIQAYGEHSGHEKCLVKINDPKYNVNNLFLSDPTYDSKFTYDVYGKKISTNTLNYILYPLDHELQNDFSEIPDEYNEEYHSSLYDSEKEIPLEKIFEAESNLLSIDSPYAKTVEQLQDTVLLTAIKSHKGEYVAPDQNGYMDKLAEERFNYLMGNDIEQE